MFHHNYAKNKGFSAICHALSSPIPRPFGFPIALCSLPRRMKNRPSNCRWCPYFYSRGFRASVLHRHVQLHLIARDLCPYTPGNARAYLRRDSGHFLLWRTPWRSHTGIPDAPAESLKKSEFRSGLRAKLLVIAESVTTWLGLSSAKSRPSRIHVTPQTG